MARRTEQGVGLVHLDDAAEIHHGNGACHMLDHGEVVADEDVGEVEVAPELGQQVEDLRLHGDIERAGRFVADDDLRLDDERAGNRHPLALSARKL